LGKRNRRQRAAERHEHQEFFKLAERFRNAANAKETKLLGDKLGRMLFGTKLLLPLIL
jgi:hypothetical protein